MLFKRSKERKRPIPNSISTPQDQNGKNGVLIADGNVIGNGNVCEMPPEENGHITPSTKTGSLFTLTRLILCFRSVEVRSRNRELDLAHHYSVF